MMHHVKFVTKLYYSDRIVYTTRFHDYFHVLWDLNTFYTVYEFIGWGAINESKG